jgi:hypothetical protein
MCFGTLFCRGESASNLQSVKTTGLNGDVPMSPTSPRRATPFTSGAGTPLLKAALAANLNKINHTQSGSGASNPGTPPVNVSANVKQRLKEYFVSRNP